MKFAFIFPGQGSQAIGMMANFAHLPVVKRTFAEASDALNVDFWHMVTEGPEDALNMTQHTQPVMLTAGIAVWRAWQESDKRLPHCVAGHSLGEYSALVAAGVLSFIDALHLVRLRAEAMQNAVPQGVGAMAAVLGLEDAAIIAACAQASQEEIVQAVNFNAPGQVVIAGHTKAVERGIALCKEMGAKRAILLPVSVPAHSFLMQAAAQTLRLALENTLFSSPTIPVLHNVDAKTHSNEEIKAVLVQQLYSPVRWVETIQQMAAQGITLFGECGPGKVLSGLTKRIVPDVIGVALTDSTALETMTNHLDTHKKMIEKSTCA